MLQFASFFLGGRILCAPNLYKNDFIIIFPAASGSCFVERKKNERFVGDMIFSCSLFVLYMRESYKAILRKKSFKNFGKLKDLNWPEAYIIFFFGPW